MLCFTKLQERVGAWEYTPDGVAISERRAARNGYSRSAALKCQHRCKMPSMIGTRAKKWSQSLKSFF